MSASSLPPATGDTYPLAAQIPLKEFKLPEFPKDDTAMHLRELTLTADINLKDYQSLVASPPPDAIVVQPPLDELPKSITHLTLELFGLGFPGTPPFLTRLARSLPNLSSVTFFSCLIDGIDDPSRKDAERFFELLAQGNKVRDVHFIDSFARPGFFKAIGGFFEAAAVAATKAGQVAGEEEGLKLVDVSYTFHGHEDSDFLARVQGEELSSLIVKGMVGASFDFVPERRDELAEEVEAEDAAAEAAATEGDAASKQENGKKKATDPKKLNEGILPFASDGRAPTATRRRFELLSPDGKLTSLRVLNLGMWSLRAVEVGEIVYACAGGSASPGLADLTVSVLLEDGWVEAFTEGLTYKGVGAALEGMEIVGVPDKAREEGDDWKSGLSVVSKADVESIAKGCPKLVKFGMSILKVKSAPNVLFLRDGGNWIAR